MKKKVIFVDVDDTLVRSVGAKRIPMPGIIRRVKELKLEGAELYLWSTGGAEYAQQTAEELGLTDCFTAYLPKPTVMIDDQPVSEWRLCKHFYPGQVEDA